jgi:DNA-damage-inducible protein D
MSDNDKAIRISEDGGSLRSSPFEQIRHETEDGSEYWSARELSRTLGYTEFGKFRNAIQKAEVACENSGQVVEDHFAHVSEMIPIGKGGKRKVEDIRMSRYACYLVVQNADPTKEIVAIGQTYFAVQTRRQEQADELAKLTEEQRRLYLRGELSSHNRRLAEAANQAGVIEPIDFAVFTDHGYQGLYGGLKHRDIHRRKGLKKSQHILDYMGGEELGANIFRVTQAEAKLRREGVKGKQQANKAHYDVGREVRDTIQRLGGTMPEELPTPQESIQQLRRQEERRLQRSPQLQIIEEGIDTASDENDAGADQGNQGSGG